MEMRSKPWILYDHDGPGHFLSERVDSIYQFVEDVLGMLDRDSEVCRKGGYNAITGRVLTDEELLERFRKTVKYFDDNKGKV